MAERKIQDPLLTLFKGACVRDTHKIDKSRCAAMVVDASFSPCLERQCKELVKKGETYGPFHRDKEVINYEPAKNYPAGKEPIPLTDISATLGMDIFSHVDLQYRDKLKDFILKYQKLVHVVQQQMIDLQTLYAAKINEYKASVIEIVILENEIQDTKTEDIIKDKARFDELTRENQRLETELLQTQQQMLGLEEMMGSCKWAMEDLTRVVGKTVEDILGKSNFIPPPIEPFASQRENVATIAKNKAQELKAERQLQQQNLEAEIKEQQAKEREEEEAKRALEQTERTRRATERLRQKEAQQQYEEEKKAEQARLEREAIAREGEVAQTRIHIQKEVNKEIGKGGVYLVVRLRCGTQDQSEDSILQFRGDTLTLRDIINVEQNKPIVIKQEEKFAIFTDATGADCQQLLALQSTLPSDADYRNAKQRLWYAFPQKSHTGASYLSFLEKEIPYLSDAEVYREEQKKSEFSNDYATLEGDVRKQKISFQALYPDHQLDPNQRKDRDFILQYLTGQEEMFKYIWKTNKQFLDLSIFNFINAPKDELPRVVSIFAIGPSGGGKTSSAKGLLKKFFSQYVSNPLYGNKNTKVVVSAYEVGLFHNEEEKKDTIKIYRLNLWNDPRLKTYSKPYLVALQGDSFTNAKSEELNGPPGSVLCENAIVNRESTGCQFANTPDKGIRAFMNLLKFDQQTDRTRETKYTPNNPTGSSRSIKIMKLTFMENIKQNKRTLATINLVDTAGYERYEMEDIKEWYKDIIANELEADPRFAAYFKSTGKSVETMASEFSDHIRQERVFINESLNYMQNSIADFRKNDRTTLNAEVQLGNTDAISRHWLLNPTLNLLPENAAVIVLGVFKPKITKNEYFATKKGISFIDSILHGTPPIDLTSEEDRFALQQDIVLVSSEPKNQPKGWRTFTDEQKEDYVKGQRNTLLLERRKNARQRLTAQKRGVIVEQPISVDESE